MTDVQELDDRRTGILVSIVIINHNYGKFLRICIESILRQTHRPLDIVVVDDGSTDDSAEILASYGDRITTILQDNLGHVRAFNTGFTACRGDVVLFVDADDMLYPRCVASVLSTWRTGLSKVQFRLDTIDASGNDLNMPSPPTHRHWTRARSGADRSPAATTHGRSRPETHMRATICSR